MAEGPDPRDAELRDLNRKFEELMRKVENKEQKEPWMQKRRFLFDDVPVICPWKPLLIHDGLSKCLATAREDSFHDMRFRSQDDGALPDWYRFPDPLIPSWLTHESPLQQPAQPDRLASVIASHEWPGRGGFNWSVCLPTNGKS